MALEGGGTSNLVRAGGAFVEVTTKDNTKAGLDSAARNLDQFSQKAKAAGGTAAAQAALNVEAIKAQELAKRGARLTLEHRTAAEKFADTQRELNQLLAAGAINQLTFGRAGKRAAEELASARSKAGLDAGSALGISSIASRLGGAIAPAALTAGLLQAGSASGSEIVEARAPDIERAQRQLGFRLDRERLQAELGGRPGQEALARALKTQAESARKEAEALVAKGRISPGGQTLGNVSDLPGGIGAVRSQDIAAARAKFNQLAVAAENLAEELNREKLQFQLTAKQFAAATADLGLSPERAQLSELSRSGRVGDANEFKKLVQRREFTQGILAGRDLAREFDLQLKTLGLPPEAARLVATATNLKLNKSLSPGQISGNLTLARTNGEAFIRGRAATAREDFLRENARNLRDQKELEALASPLRDSAFRGQLGITGGYDFGGGGQWQEEMKSTAQEQRDLQKQQLEEQQALRRIQEHMTDDLKKFTDAFTF